MSRLATTGREPGSAPQNSNSILSAKDEFQTDLNSQRARLLAWLQTATITTLQARQELDIMHPAARIQELRESGHNIMTHWAVSDIGKAKHRIARYVLLLGECDVQS